MPKLLRVLSGLCLLLAISACERGQWNNPHKKVEGDEKILYSVFSTRPKHLDPVRTYNLDEATFIDQIYEPPLEYHYLKRPYTLQPLTLTAMPEVIALDEQGKTLQDESVEPAFTEYVFDLQPGILYQPHPAFAKQTNSDKPYYDWQAASDNHYQQLDDFTEVGTKELLAEDYIYQYKRMADPALQMPIWDLIANYVVGMKQARADIVALKERAAKAGNSDNWLDLDQIEISGIKRLGPYRFSVRLHGTYPQFKYWLAFHFFAPIPREVDRFYHLPGMEAKQITLDFHPVGTGAFMMSKHDPNAEIVLIRNPNFRQAFYPQEGEPEDQEKGLLHDAGKLLPLIDKAAFSLEKEAIPVWTKFLQGYYDRSGISSDSFDQAVSVTVDGIDLSGDMKDRGVQLYTTVEPATYYLGFNMLDDVVGHGVITDGVEAADSDEQTGDRVERNRKLRRAIAIAYNEDEQISIFRNGRGEVAQSPLPPGVPGYESGESGLNTYVFDWENDRPQRKPLSEAKRLLAEAGYPEGRDIKTGKPLVLNLDTTSGGAGGNARLNWLSKQFQKLGIQLNIRATDYNRFQDKMESGNAQLFFWGWFADYPDPENFLFLLYGPNSRVGSGGAGVNSSNFNNAEYNRLFDAMKTMPDSPERMAIIRDMVAIYQRELPWASAFHPQTFVLSNSWMQNFKPHGISQAALKFQNLDVEDRALKRQAWNKPVLWPLLMMLILMLLLLWPGYLAYRRRLYRTAVQVSERISAGSGLKEKQI